jgi:signal recognition particle subunit SRP54
VDRSFTLDDFQAQLPKLLKLGMRDMFGRMPGMAEMMKAGDTPETAVERIQQMIGAMTEEEQRDPDRIDHEARLRIAASAGTEPHEVEHFLAQFDRVRALMRRMDDLSLWQWIKLVLGFGKLPGLDGEPN